MSEEFEEADEHCPNCDNHYVIEAKEPEMKMSIVMKQEKGHEGKMMKDDREKERQRVLQASTWDDDSESDEDFKVGEAVQIA